MSRILALTPDLFFSTRISSALERGSHAVRVVDTDDAPTVDEALASLNPALAVLDIGANWAWEDIMHSLRDNAPDVPVLAFGSHMDVEATKTAQSLGATRVVAKSEFVNNMLNLVERYAKKEE